MAKRKNRIENGIRAEFFGSKPHSNAEDFSRSGFARRARTIIATITAAGRITARAVVKNMIDMY